MQKKRQLDLAELLDVTPAEQPFTIGKMHVLREGADVAIFAMGTMVEQALLAAEELAKAIVALAKGTTGKPLQ